MTRPSLGLLIAVVMIGLTAGLYGSLPEPPPAESILLGESIEPGLRAGPGAFLGPAMLLGVWLVLWFFPKVDPWREPGAGGGPTYWIVGNLVLLVMASVHLLMLGLALGWPVEASWLAMVVPGLFFLAVGSYLPAVPAGSLLGVRTPWTLRDERVWQETHRLAGRTFVAGGILLFGAIFLAAEHRPLAALAGIAIAGGVPAVFSFLISRGGRR